MLDRRVLARRQAELAAQGRSRLPLGILTRPAHQTDLPATRAFHRRDPVHHLAHLAIEEIWDVLLTAGKRIYGIPVDDATTRGHVRRAR